MSKWMIGLGLNGRLIGNNLVDQWLSHSDAPIIKHVSNRRMYSTTDVDGAPPNGLGFSRAPGVLLG
jgi:hypothetical protein